MLMAPAENVWATNTNYCYERTQIAGPCEPTDLGVYSCKQSGKGYSMVRYECHGEQLNDKAFSLDSLTRAENTCAKYSLRKPFCSYENMVKTQIPCPDENGDAYCDRMVEAVKNGLTAQEAAQLSENNSPASYNTAPQSLGTKNN